MKSINKKIAILGFPKCATTSLEKHFKNIFPNCEIERHEFLWLEGEKLKDAVDYTKNELKDFDLCCIIRDPKDRLISAARYVMDWQEKYFKQVGLWCPYLQSDYDYYIKCFEKFIGRKIQIYILEHLKQLPDFPHENKTETVNPILNRD